LQVVNEVEIKFDAKNKEIEAAISASSIPLRPDSVRFDASLTGDRPLSGRPTSIAQRNSNPVSLQYAQLCNLADRSTLPKSLQLRYESVVVHRMPALQNLDNFKASLVNGTKVDSIAHGYSNPEFFLKQWCFAQEQRMHAHEREKAMRKKEKNQRGMRSSILITKAEAKNRPKSTLNWQDRYVISSIIIAINIVIICGD
jgi:hypothetical protein